MVQGLIKTFDTYYQKLLLKAVVKEALRFRIEANFQNKCSWCVSLEIRFLKKKTSFVLHRAMIIRTNRKTMLGKYLFKKKQQITVNTKFGNRKYF